MLIIDAFLGEREREREREEAKQRRVDGRFLETNTSRKVGGREAGVRMKKWRGSERRQRRHRKRTRGG